MSLETCDIQHTSSDNLLEYTDSVSVIVPCLNEEHTVEAIVETYLDCWAVDDVIVANNGSSDRTGDVAEDAGATVVYEPQKGKGHAILAGMEAAETNLVFCIDGDIGNPNVEWLEKAIDRHASGADVARAVPNSVERHQEQSLSTGSVSHVSASVSHSEVSTSPDVDRSVSSLSSSSSGSHSSSCGSVSVASESSSASGTDSVSDGASNSVLDQIRPLAEEQCPNIREMREPIGGVVLLPKEIYPKLSNYVGWDIDIGISIAVGTDEDLRYEEFNITNLIHAERTNEWYELMTQEIISSLKGDS